MLNVHYEIGILELSAVNDQQQTLELEIILNIYWKVNSLMSKNNVKKSIHRSPDLLWTPTMRTGAAETTFRRVSYWQMSSGFLTQRFWGSRQSRVWR